MGFMDIIPLTAPKNVTIETIFSDYILSDHAYSKIPKCCGMERITTEEVMNKFDMFQYKFGKMDAFGWWYLERISEDAGVLLTSTEFQD